MDIVVKGTSRNFPFYYKKIWSSNLTIACLAHSGHGEWLQIGLNHYYSWSLYPWTHFKMLINHKKLGLLGTKIKKMIPRVRKITSFRIFFFFICPEMTYMTKPGCGDRNWAVYDQFWFNWCKGASIYYGGRGLEDFSLKRHFFSWPPKIEKKKFMAPQIFYFFLVAPQNLKKIFVAPQNFQKIFVAPPKIS